MTPQQTAIVDRLKAGQQPLEICQELGCSMAEVTVLAGKYKLGPRLTPADARRRAADRQYHVTTVLDRASSDRLLRPLPPSFETTGPDGKRIVLSMPPQPSDPKQ